MIGWSIVAVYVLGWLATGIAHARWRKDEDIARYGIDHARASQAGTLASSLAIAVIWPLGVVLWALGDVFRALVVLAMRTATEVQVERELERQRTRRLARESGLPYPEDAR